MFLKQNRCGKINGRGCADGRKQHKYLTKDDTSAPTVATESIFLTCLVNAMKHQKSLRLTYLEHSFRQT